jgi:uncharacterized protein YecA (UPF0149 family)
LCYHELQGFLFAVASAPDLVRPSEWMKEVRAFPDALAEYARLGRSVSKVLIGHGVNNEPRVHTKVGRNDPCPCGSGRKYKKCCGAVA